MPEAIPLAPYHVGLTSVNQPVLYWYVSRPITQPVLFVLLDTRSLEVIYQGRLASGPQAGIQFIRLQDLSVALQAHVLYRWYVTVVMDPQRPSRDVVAGGMIERIPLSETAALPAASHERVGYYAQAGLWYDAFAAISDLIAVTPHDLSLREQRAALLRQVGLATVAEWDLRQTLGE